jgi:hypothetical protein
MIYYGETMKNIETTININMDILRMIDDVSFKAKYSRTHIIRILMKKIVIHDTDTLTKHFSLVKYQKHDKKEKWHAFHITLSPAEYEQFLDMRKVFKMSVSLIVAYAVRKYLKQLVEELTKKITTTDNNGLNNYICSKIDIGGTICWITYWGIPSRFLQKTQSEHFDSKY